MLPHFRDDQGIALCLPVDLFYDKGTCQRVRMIFQRILLFITADLLHPLRMGLLLQTLIERPEHLFHISDQFLCDNDIFIDLRGIDIDLQDLRVFGECLRVSCHTVAEPCPNDYEKVAFADPVVGGLRAVHSQHSRIPRICSRECPFPHQGIRDRRIQLFHKFFQLSAGPGSHCAAAHKDIRLFRSLEHRNGARGLFFIHMRLVGNIFPEFFFLILCDCCRDILRDIHEHRPRPSRPRDAERLADRIRQLCHIFYNETVLCDGHCDPCDIDLLETVLPEERYAHITGDGHDGDGIHVRGGDPGHQVRRPGPAGRQADADFARCPRIPVRRVRRALLMGSEDVADLIPVFIQLVIYIQDSAARIAEYGVHSLFF